MTRASAWPIGRDGERRLWLDLEAMGLTGGTGALLGTRMRRRPWSRQRIEDGFLVGGMDDGFTPRLHVMRLLSR